MSDLHIPVLLNEVVESFETLRNRDDLIYFDGTYGRGGHFKEIVRIYHPRKCYLADQDSRAIDSARKNWSHEISENQVIMYAMNFAEFAENAIEQKIDLILLDLGVSSPQLDQAERGFSFNKDGPLDMRMNQTSEMTAAKIINEFPEDELNELFKTYGEIYHSTRVVRAIVSDRVTKPFETTLQLAQMIERIDGWHKKGFHPATQYFMALRLVVNRELQVIETAIPRLINKLQDGGRISVITFHSLEDRLIKNLFKDSKEGFLVNKKVIVPSDEECKINPRARSAKLRIFQKGEEPVKPDKFALRRALRDA